MGCSLVESVDIPHPVWICVFSRDLGWGHTVGVLRPHASAVGSGSSGVGGGWGLGSRLCLVSGDAGWGGVGLLFEMWIVDASIFTAT